MNQVPVAGRIKEKLIQNQINLVKRRRKVLIKNQKETSTAVSKPEKDVAENSHSTTNGPSSTTPGNSKSKYRKKIYFRGK